MRDPFYPGHGFDMTEQLLAAREAAVLGRVLRRYLAEAVQNGYTAEASIEVPAHVLRSWAERVGLVERYAMKTAAFEENHEGGDLEMFTHTPAPLD